MCKAINTAFISQHTDLSVSEINSNVLQSYQENSDLWKLGEPPKIKHVLAVSIESLPSRYLTKLKKLMSSFPYEFFNTYTEKRSAKFEHLCLKLKFNYEEDHTEITFNKLNEYCRTKEEKEALQKKIATFEYSLRLIDTGEFRIGEIHEALIQLKLTFSGHKTYFYKKLKLFSESGNRKLFLNKNRNQSKEWKAKYTELHHLKVGELYRKGMDSQQIENELQDYCEIHGLDYVSRSTIKRKINNSSFKVINGLERHGTKFIKDKVISYVEKQKSEFKLQVVEADGSRLHLPYRKTDKSKWKIGYLTIYLIIDVPSRKVLGYWVDDFENKDMVLMAFFMMLATQRYLPAFIRIDRSSAHKSNRFKRFLRLATDLGMKHKVCYEPREKGTVENFFHWFPEKICKKYPTYTGLGPFITDWDKKLSPDKIDTIQKKYKLLPTRDQLIRFIPNLINEWNYSSIDNSLERRPIDIFNQLKFGQAIPVAETQIAFLTWNIKSKENFSRNTIAFKNDKKIRKSYRIESEENIANMFGQNYQIAWLENESKYIYVYDENEKFVDKAIEKTIYLDDPINITEMDHSMMIDEKNKNYGFIKHIKKKVKQDVQRQIDLERKFIPFNTTSGLISDKQTLHTIEEDMFLKHHNTTSNSDDKINENFENTENNDLDKNFVKANTKPKNRNKKYKDIDDVDGI